LYSLDGCGSAPARPTAYSWTPPGQRKRVAYEAPQGRRVNALAADRPYGGPPRLEAFTAERTWGSADLLGFAGGLPWAKGARGRARDTASRPTGRVAGRAGEGRAAAGIDLDFLPPYSPESNEIEPVFRRVKSREIPVRRHTTRAGLRDAVEGGFGSYRRSLR